MRQVGLEASIDEVLATLKAFDGDGSGELDAEEFHALAVRLFSRSFSGDVKYHLFWPRQPPHAR